MHECVWIFFYDCEVTVHVTVTVHVSSLFGLQLLKALYIAIESLFIPQPATQIRTILALEQWSIIVLVPGYTQFASVRVFFAEEHVLGWDSIYKHWWNKIFVLTIWRLTKKPVAGLGSRSNITIPNWTNYSLFLSSNTTSIFQPLDQWIISSV